MTYLLYAGATVFALGYLLPLVVGALAVHRLSRMESLPRFEPRSPRSMPEEVQGFIADCVLPLRAEGFEPVGYYHMLGTASKIETFVALFQNRAAGDEAAVVSGYSMNMDAPPMSNHVVGFSTEFADNTSVNVTNDSMPALFAPDARHVHYKFPGLRDFTRLYKAHRALVARHAPGRSGVLPTEGLEAVNLSNTWNRDFGRQIELGYYYEDAADGTFRPTLRGAFVMTSKCLWPVKNVRAARLRTRAAATLKSLNLN